MDGRSMGILGVDNGAHTHSRKWQFTWKVKHTVSCSRSLGLIQSTSNMVFGSVFKRCLLICFLKYNLKKSNCEHAYGTYAPKWLFTEAIFILQIKPVGKNSLQQLLKAIETGLPSLVFRFFPLFLICFAASSERCPWTTEMLTPAFSKTCPSWSTQLMPPPPVYRNVKWAKNEKQKIKCKSKKTNTPLHELMGLGLILLLYFQYLYI